MMKNLSLKHKVACGFSILILARIATLNMSSFAPNGGYVEAWSALRARGMIDGLPRVFGTLDWNTPPLHTWILWAFGNTLGWSEIAMRLPSVIAWALATIPIYRMSKNKILAAGLWLVMPLPLLMAGRATPDMLVTLFVIMFIDAHRRDDTLGMIVWFVLGILTKQVMVLVLVPLLWKKPRFAIPLVGLSLATIPFFMPHILAKGLGYWDWTGLIRAFVAGSAGLIMVCVRKDWRAYYMLPFIGFYLFAAPPLHDYYLLPIFPLIASLTADMITVRKFANIAWTGALAMGVLLLAASGGLHDTRTREMAIGNPPMIAHDSLYAIASWYYNMPIETWNGTSPGKVWSGEQPACEIWIKYPGPGVNLYEALCT